jgi:hypothetical protein
MVYPGISPPRSGNVKTGGAVLEVEMRHSAGNVLMRGAQDEVLVDPRLASSDKLAPVLASFLALNGMYAGIVIGYCRPGFPTRRDCPCRFLPYSLPWRGT